MRYVSTRGGVEPVPFRAALMAGQAPDGGLFMPEQIPDVSQRLAAWRGLSYAELAFEILRLYADDLPEADLRALVERSYRPAGEDATGVPTGFDTPEIVPLTPLDEDGLHLLELFHGPTLAFKDLALQLIGHLFDYELGRTGATLNVLGATSGDTGSAAIAALRGRTNARVFILFPEGRTSPLQELQMTTVPDANVHCIGIEGTFDDCQRIVKTLFNDAPLRERLHLGAINSVNCVRLLAQVVYYFHAWLQLSAAGELSGDGRVDFSVPTGNFGDVFAGFLAAEMGLPVARLIVATNENDILDRFFRTGVYRRGEVRRTLSPSMDIQVASNFERFLWWHLGRDAGAVRAFMAAFEAEGEARIEPEPGGSDPDAPPRFGRFVSGHADRAATLATIEHWHRATGQVLDPHTAVGVKVAMELRGGAPMVCLATAHPGKFPDAAPPGASAPTHPRLAGLETLPARKVVLANDAGEVARQLESVCAAG